MLCPDMNTAVFERLVIIKKLKGLKKNSALMNLQNKERRLRKDHGATNTGSVQNKNKEERII